MPTIAELLTQPEGKTLDFKRDLSGKKGILKNLVAFANTSGGVLVVGVDDDKSVPGLSDPLAVEEKLASLISDSITPALLPDIELATYQEKDVLVVRIARSGGPFHLTADGPENGVFIRVGSTSRRADATAIAELRRSIANVSYDQEPSPGSRSSLDDARLDKALREHNIPRTDAKLITLGVLAEHQGAHLASNGGIILFGKDDERQRLFPDAYVRCAAFAGETKGAEMLDQLDAREATIIEAISLVNGFIARNTRKAGLVEGMRRRDVPEYSDAMIREILVNALAHADYSMIGMQVKVAIFSNRMEIENPGFLPFGMTIEQFKAGQSKIRNRVIARVFNEIQYLDGWGRAWERIQEAMKLGYPEPEFIEQGATFKVVLWPHTAFATVGAREPAAAADERRPRTGARTLNREERERWILAEIQARGGLKLAEITAELGVSVRTAHRDIAGLAEKSVVFVGAPKTGRYELRPPGFRT